MVLEQRKVEQKNKRTRNIQQGTKEYPRFNKKQFVISTKGRNLKNYISQGK
jgi:hypothetical protein